MAREPVVMPLGGPGDGVTASTKSATSVAKSSPRLSTLPATFDPTQRSALLRAVSVVRPTHASKSATISLSGPSHRQPSLTDCHGRARSDSLLRHMRGHAGHAVTPPGRPEPTDKAAPAPVQTPPSPASEFRACSDPQQSPAVSPVHNASPSQPTEPPPADYASLTGLNFCEPAWLLGDEFDVDALESSISLALSEWPLQQPVVDAVPGFLAAERDTLDCPHVHLPWSLEAVHRVQQNWHTRVSRAVTAHSSSSQLPDQVIVDERYREGLTHRLQPRVSNAALPSANFLVSISLLHHVTRRYLPVLL